MPRLTYHQKKSAKHYRMYKYNPYAVHNGQYALSNLPLCAHCLAYDSVVGKATKATALEDQSSCSTRDGTCNGYISNHCDPWLFTGIDWHYWLRQHSTGRVYHAPAIVQLVLSSSIRTLDQIEREHLQNGMRQAKRDHRYRARVRVCCNEACQGGDSQIGPRSICRRGIGRLGRTGNWRAGLPIGLGEDVGLHEGIQQQR